MAKAGRNDACPCGSGRKYKKCCEGKEGSARQSRLLLLVVGGAVLAAIAAGIVTFRSDATGGPNRVWSAEHGHYHDASGGEIR